MPDQYSSDSPYAGDWSFGAFAPPGVIWIGEIPLDQARVLVDNGWNVVGQPLPPPVVASAEPALPLPPPEPPPQLTPPPGPPPPGQPEPINDPIIEPRTPITPEPLPPVGEPTLPPQPQLPPPVEVPPPFGEPLPPDIPTVPPPLVGIGIGQIIIGVGGLLWPSEITPDYGIEPPPVDIPPPHIDFPPLPADLGAPPLAEQDFPYPQPPEVIVVTPNAPPYSPSVPSVSSQPFPDWSSVLWPIIQPRPRRRTQPVPRALAPPLPVTPPIPTAPPLPVSPPLPVAPPLPISPPISAPPLPTPPPREMPLTPPQTASADSAPDGQTCETPQQTKERRERKRDSCRKLVRIHVKAHWKKVCVSEAIEHEARKIRRKVVRKYITQPAGKLGRDAADWLLKQTGLTPYAEQAKDIKKRVRDLTKPKRYRYKIPGTEFQIDPVDLIPKGKP